MSVLLRRARPHEAVKLSALAVRAKASWGYPKSWIDTWQDELSVTEAQLRGGIAWVAVEEDHLAGFCVIEREGELGSLEHLWIAPESQRRGLGRTLLKRSVDSAKAVGVKRISIHADPMAERFYLRAGARRVSSIPAPMPGAGARVLPVLELLVMS